MQILIWENLSSIEQKKALTRPDVSDNPILTNKVQDILQTVRLEGDKAIRQFTGQFDAVDIETISLTQMELNHALQAISPEAKRAIEFAKQQIEMFHAPQIPRTQVTRMQEGIIAKRVIRPIGKVGLYIPGGSAPLVSTVLMLGVPSSLAKCPVRILCTPPDRNGEIDPHILFAAQLCDITRIYKVGGAQAIGAMAYGTDTIPKVDKIFGPGNAWVTTAKKMVSQDTAAASIDMPAGPSELMVIADQTANPSFVAADLLSQAEHGVDSQVMLVTVNLAMAKAICNEIEQQLKQLPRRDIAAQSLANSKVMVVRDIPLAIDISNRYAPEHLILQVAKPNQYVSLIQHAGAVFLGKWAPETLGDYVIGTNHVLPTHGYAKCGSGLSVSDFMKYISLQSVTKKGLEKIGAYAAQLAHIESLEAHKRAVTVRLKNEEKNNVKE